MAQVLSSLSQGTVRDPHHKSSPGDGALRPTPEWKPPTTATTGRGECAHSKAVWPPTSLRTFLWNRLCPCFPTFGLPCFFSIQKISLFFLFGSGQKRPGANRPPEFVQKVPSKKRSLGVIFSPRNYRETHTQNLLLPICVSKLFEGSVERTTPCFC